MATGEVAICSFLPGMSYEIRLAAMKNNSGTIEEYACEINKSAEWLKSKCGSTVLNISKKVIALMPLP